MQNIVIQFETHEGNLTIVSDYHIAPDVVTDFKNTLQNRGYNILSTRITAPSNWGGGALSEEDKNTALCYYQQEGKVAAVRFIRARYGFHLREAVAILDHIRYLKGV